MNTTLIIYLLCFSLHAEQTNNKSHLSITESLYFDTQWLKRTDEINKKLINKEGFTELKMKSIDGSTTSILLKQKANAQYTLICFGGFGTKKESLAPFYALFKDQPCNVWLCQTRSATQHTLRRAFEFGTKNDQDAISCIQRAHAFSPKPIIIWGTCAGAFYATHALATLTLEKKVEEYNIKGIIFDSGWAAVHEAAVEEVKGAAREKIAQVIKSHPRDINKSWMGRILNNTSNWIIDTLHYYTSRPFFAKISSQKNLFEIVKTIAIPMFFIHSEDDYKKPLSEAKKLYIAAPIKTAWWITFPSTHSMHHFKHKDEYKKRCINFINKALKFQRSIYNSSLSPHNT